MSHLFEGWAFRSSTYEKSAFGDLVVHVWPLIRPQIVSQFPGSLTSANSSCFFCEGLAFVRILSHLRSSSSFFFPFLLAQRLCTNFLNSSTSAQQFKLRPSLSAKHLATSSRDFLTSSPTSI